MEIKKKKNLELPLMVLSSRQNTWRVCINYCIDWFCGLVKCG